MKNIPVSFFLLLISSLLLMSCEEEQKKKIQIEDLKDSTRAYTDEVKKETIQEILFFDEHDSSIDQEKFNQKIAQGNYLPLEVQGMEGRNEVHLVTLEQHEMDLENMELPEFSIQDLNGNLYNKSSMNGKVVIFSFWFTASNINVNELQALNQLAAEYKNNEQVLWLAPALDNKDQLSRFLKDKGWVYRFAANQEDFALDLGVLAYPTHIIVDAEGNIHKAIVRSSKAQEVLENNITQLLN